MSTSSKMTLGTVNEITDFNSASANQVGVVSNSINVLCEKLFELLKMKLGRDALPTQISQESDQAMEREFGKALELFDLECDNLSNDIEMEKKEFINYFLKYGADNMMTDKLIQEYKSQRDKNFNHIIGELEDIHTKLDDGFVNDDRANEL